MNDLVKKWLRCEGVYDDDTATRVAEACECQLDREVLAEFLRREAEGTDDDDWQTDFEQRRDRAAAAGRESRIPVEEMNMENGFEHDARITRLERERCLRICRNFATACNCESLRRAEQGLLDDSKEFSERAKAAEAIAQDIEKGEAT